MVQNGNNRFGAKSKIVFALVLARALCTAVYQLAVVPLCCVSLLALRIRHPMSHPLTSRLAPVALGRDLHQRRQGVPACQINIH